VQREMSPCWDLKPTPSELRRSLGRRIDRCIPFLLRFRPLCTLSRSGPAIFKWVCLTYPNTWQVCHVLISCFVELAKKFATSMCKLVNHVACTNYPILLANDDGKCCHTWKMYPVSVFQNKLGNVMMFRRRIGW